ncbi:MAG TPA: SpoIIE family protein phosphatase [Solirubrobacteraceae bacterium]|nr:SpoIIE family protein phosphatase [Solirubrobacteraceae bacterium]
MSQGHPGPGSVELMQALARSGEIGEALAAVDWAATPLGPPAGWDRSLQTMVRVLVSSRFSMWMAWGPELSFFCNDAYRRDTLAEKYPWALGRPAREVWAEIWSDIGPRIERVLRTGEATWDESLLLFVQRSGYVEETYHTFSYSPLPDDRGDIAGMLCVVTEDTQRVIGERRMRTLRDLGAVEAVGQDEVGLLRAATTALGGSDRSLPFTAVYLFDGDGVAHLASTSRLTPGGPAAPLRIEPGDPTTLWPVDLARAGETVIVEDLDRRGIDLPTGAWKEPPHTAIVAPLPAQIAGAPPVGMLVIGANRYRPLDASYHSFIDLLAAQLAAGVAGARSFEAERRRAEELARLDEAKTTFFTNVSHELRTPLTLLLAPAEDMLATATARPPADAGRLELIVRNGQRLLKLVNTLLDFSRLQSGRNEAVFEPVDLAPYTGELVSMFESAMDQAGLALIIELEPLARPVWIDREMWAKIVLNLVSNALKFTIAGSVTVRVRALDETTVRLEVQDTGIGISAADQARLFERFHRVSGSAARTYEGTGIGLALVAELAELHGGRTTVDSEPDVGSLFGVELPFGPQQLPPGQLAPEGIGDGDGDAERTASAFLAEMTTWLPDLEEVLPGPTGPTGPAAGAGAVPASPRAAPAGGGGSVNERPRVLIVDDNADMRRYVTSLLEPIYRVEQAADGAAGVEAALANPPDLILTDVTMPRLDGFGLLAALRGEPRTMHVPVVMLSARAGEEGMVEGLEAGADDYLIKPFTARELIARVASNLELDRVRRVRDQLRRGREIQDQAERLARVGSWEIDLETKTVRGSTQFQAMVGRDVAALATMDYRDAITEVIDERDREQVSASILAALSSHEPFEYETRLAGQPDRWMLVRGEFVAGAAGGPGVLRGFMQDVTQQRAAEQAIAVAAAAREAAEREHAIADELQRSLLPGDDLSNSRLDVAGFYRAGVEGTRAGGDFYDVIDLGATRSAIVVGDVSGRGVRAASLMGQLRAAIHAHARLDLPPADVLEQLDLLVRELGHGSLVTCIYGIHDHSEDSFVYASAGHLPIILCDAGAFSARRLHGPTGPPLGAGDAQYGEELARFVPGTTLVLYTDGLVERRRESLDTNIDRVVATVSAYEGPLERLPEALVTALGAQRIEDDVAILAVRSVGAAHERSIEHDVGSFPTEVRRARRFTALTLEDWGIPNRVIQDAVTVVSELATNAITYGRPPIRLRLRASVSELVIEMDDALAALPRKTTADVTQVHGRGLRIVSQLSERWNARATGSGKTVWCSLTLPSAPGEAAEGRR